MKLTSPTKKMLCVTLALLFIALPLMAQQPSDGGYAQGRVDGQRDGHGNAVWGLAGCLLDWIGILVAYLVAPSVPGTALMGKSPEYIQGYTEAYQSKSKLQNAEWAAGGCVIGTIGWVALYFALWASVY
jgi:hypothetical protein